MIKIIKENNSTIINCIKGITLLSIDEYFKYKNKIPSINNTYEDFPTLTRTSGNENCFVRSYNPTKDDQFIEEYGKYLKVNEYGNVRPVLIISNLNKIGLKINNTFNFGGHSFTIISPKLAISNEIFRRMPFNKKMRDGNDYENSDVKKYLDDWFNNVIEGSKTNEIKDNSNDLIVGIDLLSYNKADNLSKHKKIIQCPNPWWVKDEDNNIIFIVDNDARHCFYNNFSGITPDKCGLRPVLILKNIKKYNLSIGSKLKVGGYSFTIISPNQAISDYIIANCELYECEYRLYGLFSEILSKSPQYLNKYNTELLLNHGDGPGRAIALEWRKQNGLIGNRFDRMQKEIDDLFGDL